MNSPPKSCHTQQAQTCENANFLEEAVSQQRQEDQELTWVKSESGEYFRKTTLMESLSIKTLLPDLKAHVAPDLQICFWFGLCISFRFGLCATVPSLENGEGISCGSLIFPLYPESLVKGGFSGLLKASLSSLFLHCSLFPQ